MNIGDKAPDIYSIRTDDGVNIHVRNRGLVCDGKNADGTPYY